MSRSLLVSLALVLAACPPPGALPDEVAGVCDDYDNRFSSNAECREYLGEWDLTEAEADCANEGGSFASDRRCDLTNSVGACAIGDADTPIRVVFKEGSCRENQRGCEIFARGRWLPEGDCGPDKPAQPDVLTNPFPEPEYVCVEPLPGEEAGAGEDGTVCQWITMQGCTEPGREWEDYGSCELPRQQRGYYFVDTAEDALREDPRLADPTYSAELAWVKSEIAACSCVCCHLSTGPEGPSNWYLDQPGNFINGMFDTGIAMGAGITDSATLGDYEAADNNGFTRLPSIFPSTNPARMQAFFQAEFDHRGLRAQDFPAKAELGPLSEQEDFIAEPCEEGVGVVDGALVWRGGGARLVHILAADAANPGVPPDRDTPAGTVWRIDAAAPTEALIKSGVAVGVVPAGAVQRVPASGAPTLTRGTTYKLYVSADYLQPIERCTFVF